MSVSPRMYCTEGGSGTSKLEKLQLPHTWSAHILVKNNNIIMSEKTVVLFDEQIQTQQQRSRVG